MVTSKTPKDSAQQLKANYLDALDTKLQSRSVQTNAAGQQPVPQIDINHELARSQQLQNDNAEQDIRLKRVVLNRLFWFLGVETSVIFLFSLFQAVGWFHLDGTSFNLLISATIAQITAMLFVAVRYLFPTKDGK